MKKVRPNTPGYRLRELRKSRDLTLDDLAAATGFSRSHINHMELNTYTGGRAAWQAVSGALGEPFELFFSGADMEGIEDPRGLPPGEREFTKNVNELRLLKAFRQLDDREQALFIRMLEGLPPPRGKLDDVGGRSG